MAVSGKVISGGILGITAAFGIGVYYAQVYGYYETFTRGRGGLDLNRQWRANTHSGDGV